MMDGSSLREDLSTLPVLLGAKKRAVIETLAGNIVVHCHCQGLVVSDGIKAAKITHACSACQRRVGAPDQPDAIAVIRGICGDTEGEVQRHTPVCDGIGGTDFYAVVIRRNDLRGEKTELPSRTLVISRPENNRLSRREVPPIDRGRIEPIAGLFIKLLDGVLRTSAKIGEAVIPVLWRSKADRRKNQALRPEKLLLHALSYR